MKRRLAAVEAERDGEQRRLIMRRDADRRRTESYTKFAEAAAEASKREEALREQLREAQNRGTRRARDLEALRRAAEDRCTDAEREARRLTDEVDALRRRLPITRVKFDWDNKASVHKLATGLNAFKMG